jgi:hypothetical protein
VRTTVTIDDRLLALAKERARAERRTLGQVVEDALQHHLMREQVVATSELPVFAQGTGIRPGVNAGTNRGLLDALEEGVG